MLDMIVLQNTGSAVYPLEAAIYELWDAGSFEDRHHPSSW
jgi:hypothetical protein